jgi:hypothetical protein
VKIANVAVAARKRQRLVAAAKTTASAVTVAKLVLAPAVKIANAAVAASKEPCRELENWRTTVRLSLSGLTGNVRFQSRNRKLEFPDCLLTTTNAYCIMRKVTMQKSR